MKQLLVLLALVLMPFHSMAEVNPIVSRALVTKEISRENAKNLYLLRERAWLDGTKVQIIRMPLRDPTHIAFVRDVLQMSDAAFDKEWKRLVNAGLAPQIYEVRTENDMINTLSRKHNGVGYLSRDYLILHLGGHDVTIIRITD